MSSKKPVVIYPEYFDHRLKRSEGRKVPLSKAVKSPKVEKNIPQVSRSTEKNDLKKI